MRPPVSVTRVLQQLLRTLLAHHDQQVRCASLPRLWTRPEPADPSDDCRCLNSKLRNGT